jgi:hypothetical protein
VRHNLRVKHGDVITIHPCPDIKYVSGEGCTLAYCDSNKLRSRPSVSPFSLSQIPSRVSQAHYSTYSLLRISGKPTGLFARAIPSQLAVV